MNDQLKGRIDFTSSPQLEHSSQLRTGSAFSQPASEQFVPSPPDDGLASQQVEQIMHSALLPKRSLWRKMVTVALVLFVVSALLQSGQWLYHAWQQQDWGVLVAGGATALVLFATVGTVIAEWRRLYRLRHRNQIRDQARELLQSHDVGNGQLFCQKLAREAGLNAEHPALQRWRLSLHESQSDGEVLTLYAQIVQPEIDSHARREINRSAVESALMIAVSPLALLDMAFIAWRNIRLINRIAGLYGIELGYFSRIRLLKLVLLNIAFAGASELVREVGMDWMSQDMVARLSTRAAQGIGAGLLTARLGIKAMELCRPLPWLADEKPKLSEFRHHLLSQLKETVKSSGSKA
ncbi:YcjF family protein [Serratia microhaemolytica]|uniref:YcjF family protein n=1 Tax=Serratia microhaemolytica TaxID=2675110 RepID=UPI000FDEED6A|nr:TIGR01620 family protein [Serratia microhaemolytica]